MGRIGYSLIQILDEVALFEKNKHRIKSFFFHLHSSFALTPCIFQPVVCFDT